MATHTLTLEIPETVECEHKGKTIAYDLWSRLWEKAVNAGTDPEDSAALADYLVRTVAGRWCALDQDVKARKAGKPATVYVSRNADDREKYIKAALKAAPEAMAGVGYAAKAHTMAEAHAAHAKAKAPKASKAPKARKAKAAQTTLPLPDPKAKAAQS